MSQEEETEAQIDPCHRRHRICGQRNRAPAAVARPEVAAMVRDAGAAGERLPPQVTLRVADYEDSSALRSALAAPIR